MAIGIHPASQELNCDVVVLVLWRVDTPYLTLVGDLITCVISCARLSLFLSLSGSLVISSIRAKFMYGVYLSYRFSNIVFRIPAFDDVITSRAFDFHSRLHGPHSLDRISRFAWMFSYWASMSSVSMALSMLSQVCCWVVVVKGVLLNRVLLRVIHMEYRVVMYIDCQSFLFLTFRWSPFIAVIVSQIDIIVSLFLFAMIFHNCNEVFHAFWATSEKMNNVSLVSCDGRSAELEVGCVMLLLCICDTTATLLMVNLHMNSRCLCVRYDAFHRCLYSCDLDILS